jgi:hypothetical protein
VLTDSSPGTATVESIQTMDAKSGEVVDSLAGANVAARTVFLGDISGAIAEEVHPPISAATPQAGRAG